MPKGVYEKTAKHRKALSDALIGHSVSQKQLDALDKGRRLPATQKKIEAARKSGLRNNADTICKHHNDLCHGAERPDDVAYMTSSEHTRLHANIRIKNGTHNFLTKNWRQER